MSWPEVANNAVNMIGVIGVVYIFVFGFVHFFK